MIGHVKACHDPRNKLCPHNLRIQFNCDCKSDKVVTRKPYRTIRVIDRTADLHPVGDRFTTEIHPNGLLVVRETGRRRRYETTIGKIISRLMRQEATAIARAKRKGRSKTKLTKT